MGSIVVLATGLTTRPISTAESGEGVDRLHSRTLRASTFARDGADLEERTVGTPPVAALPGRPPSPRAGPTVRPLLRGSELKVRLKVTAAGTPAGAGRADRAGRRHDPVDTSPTLLPVAVTGLAVGPEPVARADGLGERRHSLKHLAGRTPSGARWTDSTGAAGPSHREFGAAA
jgi:hypothetical protein